MLGALLFDFEALLKASAIAMLSAILVPYVTMWIHLATTPTLSSRQKRDWRRASMWGLFEFVTPFFYLTRADRRPK
jgi:hypothetical protein